MSNKQTPSFESMGIDHVSVREARENFAPLLTGVATTSERVVLTRHGRPWVAIVDIDDLSELVKLDDEKLNVFALAHHESVNDITKNHFSTQKEVTNILEAEDIDSFPDTASMKEQALESQVKELQRENEELQRENEELHIKKAHLEGMVEVYRNTRKMHSQITGELREFVVQAVGEPRNQSRVHVHSNSSSTSKFRGMVAGRLTHRHSKFPHE